MTLELQSMVDREVEEAVKDALARSGAAGVVRVLGTDVVVEGHGPTVRWPVADLLRAWPGLAPEVRRRRSTDVARQLIESRCAAKTSSQEPGASPALGWLRIAGAVGLGAIAVWGAHAWLGPPSTPTGRQANVRKSPAGPELRAEDYERQRLARADRVCRSTQARVERGASVGPTDVEGWVVELLMLRRSGADWLRDGGLDAFISRSPDPAAGRVVWAGAPTLRGLEGPGTEVSVELSQVGSSAGMQSLRFTFQGRYVTPYFTAEQRPEFVALASEVTARLAADFAGLYARCAAGTTHHLGSWFYGTDPGGAAAALLYIIGSYARSPGLDSMRSRADAGKDRSQLLEQLVELTEGLTRAQVSMLIGGHGGMIAGRPGQSASLLFPFDDGNRAARASRELAETLGRIAERSL